MKKTYRSLVVVALLGAATLPMTVGCGGSASNNQASGESNSSSVTSTALADPTFQPKVLESTDSAPQHTVAVFLDSLRRGDETIANSMLTPLARTEIGQTNYAIQPPGTQDGKFEIGRLGFPYPEQTIALVECQWIEPANAGQPELRIDIVCEVRQETEGWRIAGMAMTIVGESEPLVIDFEDRQQLQQLLDMANGVTTPAQTPLQVALPGQGTDQLSLPGQTVSNQFGPGVSGGVATQTTQQPTNTNGGLPPLPSFPSGGTQQVASPPSSNVLR